MRRRTEIEVAFLFGAALAFGFCGGRHPAPVAPDPALVVTVPRTPASGGYRGPVAACDVDGHRIVTDPADAATAKLRPCLTAP